MCVLSLYRNKLDFKHPRPPFAGDVKGVGVRVVRDPVEHLGSDQVVTLQQAGGVDDVRHTSVLRVDPNQEIVFPDVGVHRPVDAFELIQFGKRLAAERDPLLANRFKTNPLP